MVLNSAVPSLFWGGAPGANQEVTWSFQLPASFASFWCSGPGVAAFMYFSMAACSAGAICGGPDGFASWPLAVPIDAAVRSSATAENLDGVMANLPWAGRIATGSSAFQQGLHRDAFQKLAVVLVQVDEGESQLARPAPDHLSLHQQRDPPLRDLDGEVDLRSGRDHLRDPDGQPARSHGAGGQGRQLVRREDVHLQLGRRPQMLAALGHPSRGPDV